MGLIPICCKSLLLKAQLHLDSFGGTLLSVAVTLIVRLSEQKSFHSRMTSYKIWTLKLYESDFQDIKSCTWHLPVGRVWILTGQYKGLWQSPPPRRVLRGPAVGTPITICDDLKFLPQHKFQSRQDLKSVTDSTRRQDSVKVDACRI